MLDVTKIGLRAEILIEISVPKWVTSKVTYRVS